MGTTDSGGGAAQPPGGDGRRRRRVPGGLVTIGTVAALVAGLGLTVLGLGAADNAVASYDASSWLWSTTRGELARVNGVTAKVDTRTQVAQAQGHTMQVVQTDRMLLLRDLNTGQVSSLDLATLQVMAGTPTTAGLGVSVALDPAGAFVVDAVQGVVRQLDPRSLQPVGEPVNFPPGITGGTFDGAGRLWVGVPSQGTVTAITPAALPSAPASDGGAGAAGVGPKLVKTVTVAPPSHDLAVSTLDDGVAVLDRTVGALSTVRGAEQRTVPLQLAGAGAMPGRTSGTTVPVTVPDSRDVVVVDQAGATKRFAVPGEGAALQPAVAWAGLYYVADPANGMIWALDVDGQVVDKIDSRDTPGVLELEVRENHLFINSPTSAIARVVDDRRTVSKVDKYANDILGGDPPPAPPPPPPPKKPVVSRPSAPRSVTASAGNAQARVSWRPAAANGSTIIRYVVTGAGRSVEVGANQRSVEFTGLTNGKTYRFKVHAVNGKGAGPDRTSNPVVPTSEVPDAPESVTAQARPDGTVLVRWPAANGQGYDITKYAVTSVSAGTTAPVGDSKKTELVIRAGELEYGTQYAFTVVAVNEKGAGSKASPVSDTVVPFSTPAAPAGLTARTVAGEAGAISVVWSPAVDNGRPISRYVVEAAGRKVEVTGTSTTLTGLGDGQNVTVKVHAVNEAGAGAVSSATARTVAPPKVTVTGSSAGVTSATVTFTVDAGGGKATCTLTPKGESAVSGGCSSIKATGLAPGTSYTFTVTARNAAGTGTATRTQATDVLYGTATCNNGSSGDQKTYCDSDRPNERNGNEIFSGTRQVNSEQVGWAKPGTRLKSYCRKSGEEVYAYIYNNEKRSTWWVQVDYKGRNYIPWAWLNLDGGDDLNVLPTC
ncbi:fibronectin type III domain-containing protein [Plantactinospora sp. KBS50]|uniref:fibronectin type III domain-containing protein n=1 Tax=Plantactinospora sp. KBS50 TaxID=2024580 RepID=UPI001E49DCC8|nr:fibronectin type III domain-containing protein [Plantactinospora sp. KBS50]